MVNLLLLVSDNQILLAKKKRGFGEGLFNGCGGKVEFGETIEEAMLREAYEELNIKPLDLEKVAINTYNIIYKGSRTELITHVFIARNYEGVIKESEEMKPFWFNIDKIPYDNMWQDDPYWLPLVLKGNKVVTYFLFDDEGRIISDDVKIVESL